MGALPREIFATPAKMFNADVAKQRDESSTSGAVERIARKLKSWRWESSRSISRRRLTALIPAWFALAISRKPATAADSQADPTPAPSDRPIAGTIRIDGIPTIVTLVPKERWDDERLSSFPEGAYGIESFSPTHVMVIQHIPRWELREVIAEPQPYPTFVDTSLSAFDTAIIERRWEDGATDHCRVCVKCTAFRHDRHCQMMCLIALDKGIPVPSLEDAALYTPRKGGVR